MTSHAQEHRSVDSVFNAIANWVKKYRQAVGMKDEFANCGPDEVAAIARDIGLSRQELEFIANKGAHAADELPKLLRALGIDPQKLASDGRATFRDLQRICITCGHKNQCQHDLAAGTATSHYREYCPNAMSIDEIFHLSAE